MIDRAAGQRVERVGNMPPVTVPVTTVIARGRHGIARQGEQFLCVVPVIARRIEGYTPGRAIGFEPADFQFASGLHHVVMHAKRVHPLGDTVYSVTGGDAVEVHLHGSVLAQLLPDDAQVAIAHQRAGPGQLPHQRHLFKQRMSAQPP
ncbi:hypothetical protein ALP75_203399 [Pseudomonas syringae pv. actinidiae]|nr:hypothetical protein ALP75_203399 [Pseudomonas syringae pv. actinidiae]